MKEIKRFFAFSVIFEIDKTNIEYLIWDSKNRYDTVSKSVSDKQ